MKHRVLILFAISTALVSGFFCLYGYGYARERRLFIEKYGADQVHEFLYFGSKWDSFGFLALLLAAVLAILGVYFWFKRSPHRDDAK